MNIIFISIGGLNDLSENAVYPDLLRKFSNNGHNVYVVCQRERKHRKKTELLYEYGINVIRVKTGNITKTNIIEKGISTLLIGYNFKSGIKKYAKKIKFDIILYSTPPITVATTVKFLKKRDNAFSYLMLKDIFPQNAVDIGILNNRGIKKYILEYFKRKEKQLYKISDFIGCMSKENVNFLLRNNQYLCDDKVGLCPNTIDINKNEVNSSKCVLKNKYKLPNDKIVFMYGGNFGKPQDINYIIHVLQSNKDNKKCHFVMCGSGTEFYKLKNVVENEKINNVTIISVLPKKDYYELLDACDVGMIFLDHRFTIPNFPSRLLDYLNHELPVLAATDPNTDLGRIIVDNNFGWWCVSDSIDNFQNELYTIISDPDDIIKRGKIGKNFLEDNYQTKVSYNNIIDSYNVFKGDK